MCLKNWCDTVLVL